MALPSVRYEFRLTLSDVDRGVEIAEPQSLVAARHPSETAEHLCLRVLAFALLYREGLVFGAGLSDGDASDLEARDATGRIVLWAECGAASAEKVRRVTQQNPDARVHVMCSEARRREELLAEFHAEKRAFKAADRVCVWSLDPALVDALAAHESRRQRWALTLVDGTAYLDVDGNPFSGTYESVSLASLLST